MIYIYALVDPFSKDIRYIGKSIRPKQRLSAHCNEKSITHRTNWIKSVLKKGKRPELIILETLPAGSDWQKSEMEWIAKGREKGWRLTNGTDGGDGVPGHKMKNSTWIDRKHTEESKRLIGEKSKGRKHSQESKDRMRDLMTGREIKWVEKIRKAVSKLSDEQIIEIRKMISEGISQYVIADIFGVHQGTISNIKRGKTYQHLGE